MQPCIYILLLANDQYYIGSTTDLERRLNEHHQKDHAGTKYSTPLKVVFRQSCSSYIEARRLEMRLKKLKSRKIIEKIIKSGEITLNNT